SRRPEASEKLIAACAGTPSASRTPDVAPMLTIAPPAVIGRIDAAAAMHMITSAKVGEKPTPSAQRSSVLPSARISQQVSRKPPAANVDDERAVLPPTRRQAACRRDDRDTSGRPAIRGPKLNRPRQTMQKSSTTTRGARKTTPEVASAITESGSIATASTRPS